MWKKPDKNQIPILELPRQIMVHQDSQVFGKLVWLKEVEKSQIKVEGKSFWISFEAWEICASLYLRLEIDYNRSFLFFFGF